MSASALEDVTGNRGKLNHRKDAKEYKPSQNISGKGIDTIMWTVSEAELPYHEVNAEQQVSNGNQPDCGLGSRANILSFQNWESNS